MRRRWIAAPLLAAPLLAAALVALLAGATNGCQARADQAAHDRHPARGSNEGPGAYTCDTHLDRAAGDVTADISGGKFVLYAQTTTTCGDPENYPLTQRVNIEISFGPTRFGPFKLIPGGTTARFPIYDPCNKVAAGVPRVCKLTLPVCKVGYVETDVHVTGTRKDGYHYVDSLPHPVVKPIRSCPKPRNTHEGN